MDPRPTIINAREADWESWPPDQVDERGTVSWKTLISSEATPSNTLSVGIAKLEPGQALREHRHEHAEVYLVLAGTACLAAGEERRFVGPGDAVFIPGGCVHSIEADEEEVRFAYVFAADSTDEVDYEFTS